MTQPILEVKNLRTHFYTDDGEIPAVDNVSFHINKGEVLGIVGESGCGKSVTSLSIMRLVPDPPGKIVGGEILFNNEDLVKVKEKRMRSIRGNDIAMIFQEPMTSLNPVFTIGRQVSEAIRIHKKVSKQKAREMAIDMIRSVGIPRPEQIVDAYPHQLSGGMRQRVMIAMAMSCEPLLLIADEPTTALDVTIQAQILDLMKTLNKEKGTAIMLITHDLGVVADICDRVIVMYSGQIIEEGDVRTILKNPKHPYTQGLIKSLPKLHQKAERLYSIPGQVPKPGTIKQGCRFAPRCEFVFDACYLQDPELLEMSPGHRCRCLLYEREGGAQVG
ncbi:dipeptide/oligopeptide/nickel ABC transporter ATP-binding protein [Caldalkalibacillus thermarum]|uniref:ABC transporter ATP-binding protein n=1 Tax=Caldalkalibacillus thermarum TaxID=296745 RepID=UPI001668ED68|nr:ABC transporter ATP-binding protein [Caldalkalibacillus thermarum]GGK30546.1 dipeptide/oligopeptide/nickel ABC transporter ATP-binding protein [Caldalkalibacillus thermarum]